MHVGPLLESSFSRQLVCTFDKTENVFFRVFTLFMYVFIYIIILRNMMIPCFHLLIFTSKIGFYFLRVLLCTPRTPFHRRSLVAFYYNSSYTDDIPIPHIPIPKTYQHYFANYKSELKRRTKLQANIYLQHQAHRYDNVATNKLHNFPNVNRAMNPADCHPISMFNLLLRYEMTVENIFLKITFLRKAYFPTRLVLHITVN